MANRILVTGANGQLGRALRQVLGDGGPYCTRAELDITNRDQVLGFNYRDVDTIINAAAYTKVDLAETSEHRQEAERVNIDAVGYLAEAANVNHLRLIHLSTDYVFDGKSRRAYRTSDRPNSTSVYGQTKLAGEGKAAQARRHLIVRTAWLYGDGNNFVRTMLKLGHTQDDVSVVYDQIGRPTYTVDLAKFLVKLAQRCMLRNVCHFTNGGQPISWAQFARAIFRLTGLPTHVIPISTAEYIVMHSPDKPIAPRPRNSVLSMAGSVRGLYAPEWHNALKRYLAQEGWRS